MRVDSACHDAHQGKVSESAKKAAQHQESAADHFCTTDEPTQLLGIDVERNLRKFAERLLPQRRPRD